MPNGDIELTVGLDTKDVTKQAKQLSSEIDKILKESKDSKDSKTQALNAQLRKAQETADKLVSSMEELGKQTMPSKEYTELSNSFATASSSALDLKNAIEQDTNKLAQLNAKLKQLESTPVSMSKLSKSERAEIINTEAELKKLQAQYDKLKNTLAEYRSMGLSIKDSAYKVDAEQMQAISNKMTQLEEKQQAIYSHSIKSSDAYIKLNYQAAELSGKLQENEIKMQGFNTQANEAAAKMAQMEAEGKHIITGAETEEYAKLNSQLSAAVDKMKVGVVKQYEMADAAEKTADAAGNTSAATHKTSGVFKSLIAGILTFNSHAKKTPSILNTVKKSTSHIFRNILKWGLGIRGTFMLIRKLRTAIKEGFSNYIDARPMSLLAQQINDLKASLAQLKNSFAAAFAPIAEMAIPYIQQLIAWVNSLVSSIAQVIGAIMGRTTYTRAVKQSVGATNGSTKATKKNTKALKDNNKEINDQVSGLDKLNIINEDRKDAIDDINDAMDDIGGAGGIGNLFEEVPIESKFKDWIDKIKSIYAKEGWRGLGRALGEWIQNGLDSIPWDEIKEKVGEIARGIAEFLNGLITPETLGSIGRFLAEFINTIVTAIYEFITTADTSQWGAAFAELINEFISTWDASKSAETLNELVDKLEDFIISAFKNVNWENVKDKAKEFFGSLEFDTLAVIIGGIALKWAGSKSGKNIIKAGAIASADWIKAKLAAAIAWLEMTADGLALKFSVDTILLTIADVGSYLLSTIGSYLPGLPDVIQYWLDERNREEEAATWKKLGTVIWEGIKEALRYTWNELLSWDGWNKRNIENEAKIQEGGEGIALGVANGILNFIFAPLVAIRELVQETIDKFKSLFGIGQDGSSTVMETNAQAVGVGIGAGLTNNTTLSKVLSSITLVANTIKTGWDNFWLRNTLDLPEINMAIKNGAIAGASAGNIRIPGHAAGQVIPPSMGQYLAVLGDNNKETEVVSPLSTMKQALLEALQQAGGVGGGVAQDNRPIVIQIDGHTVFTAMRKQNNIYKAQNGSSAFA